MKNTEKLNQEEVVVEESELDYVEGVESNDEINDLTEESN